MHKALLSAGILFLVPSLHLSAQTKVYYPDNVITSPAGQYPIYTPTNGNTCRLQIIIPGTFSGFPTTAGLVTKVGCQIAGIEDYTTFVVRAGIAGVNALTTTFTTNLPDTRTQVDLSGTKLIGGGTQPSPANVWVEFDICNPFFWTPGQSICIDFMSKSKVAGVYCKSAIGSGVARMYNLSYTPTTTTGTVSASGGIKLMVVIDDPTKVVSYDKGCPGTNNVTPILGYRGSTKLGSGPLFLDLSQARSNAKTILAIGVNCQNFRLNANCRLNPSLDVLLFGTTSNTGTYTVAGGVPSNTSLRGVTIYTQYAVDDPNAQSTPYTFSLSNTGIIVFN
jgi:hypothetical protein